MITATITGRDVQFREFKRGVSTMVNATDRPFHSLEPGGVAHFDPDTSKLLAMHGREDRAICEHCRLIGL